MSKSRGKTESLWSQKLIMECAYCTHSKLEHSPKCGSIVDYIYCDCQQFEDERICDCGHGLSNHLPPEKLESYYDFCSKCNCQQFEYKQPQSENIDPDLYCERGTD